MKAEQKYWKVVNEIYDMSSTFTFSKEGDDLKLNRFGFKYGSANVHVYLGDPRWQTWIHVYYSMDDSDWMFPFVEVDEKMIQDMTEALTHCFLKDLVEDIGI